MDLRNKTLEQLHELKKINSNALARQKHEFSVTQSKAEYQRMQKTQSDLAEIKAEIKKREHR